LAGGTGDLTDGYIETLQWFQVENAAGTGPYVGWYWFGAVNPILTFNFAGAPTINQISLWIDNGGVGGVVAPDAIYVDGVMQNFTAPSGVGEIALTGLNLTGGSHTVQLFNQPGYWIFSSEIQFFGTAGGVPEPATWVMLLAGFGAAGAGMRRRKALLVTAKV